MCNRYRYMKMQHGGCMDYSVEEWSKGGRRNEMGEHIIAEALNYIGGGWTNYENRRKIEVRGEEMGRFASLLFLHCLFEKWVYWGGSIKREAVYL